LQFWHKSNLWITIEYNYALEYVVTRLYRSTKALGKNLCHIFLHNSLGIFWGFWGVYEKILPPSPSVVVVVVKQDCDTLSVCIHDVRKGEKLQCYLQAAPSHRRPACTRSSTSPPLVLIAGLHSAHPQQHTADSDTRTRPPGELLATHKSETAGSARQGWQGISWRRAGWRRNPPVKSEVIAIARTAPSS